MRLRNSFNISSFNTHPANDTCEVQKLKYWAHNFDFRNGFK